MRGVLMKPSVLLIVSLIFTLVSTSVLIGCSSEPEPEPASVPEVRPPEPSEEVMVKKEEPSPVTDIEEEQGPEQEKETEERQMELGSTKIEEEELTLIANLNCTFGKEVAESFSFRLTNTEDKEWAFAPISYSERERFNNPIVTINALQVTNNQLIDSCGKSRLSPGQSVLCDFDLEDPSNTILKKSLRSGETGLGNYKSNIISVRTPAHAAEATFWCE